MALVKLVYSSFVMPPRDSGTQLLDEGWSKGVFAEKENQKPKPKNPQPLSTPGH